ncbi:alpha/beta hydrolase [Aliiroseovarius sp. PTFE2010]|uniref:alpha/beta hydrolase n=1 Tax=Aliiroseovarius sp. PTFE2010 TaxID=3417190 RepID=UPI003CF0311A
MHKARGDASPTVQAPDHSYTARDGSTLPYRWFPTDNPAAPTLILLHGSAWHSAQFIALATRLAQDGSANVAAPDLRGDGFDPKRRGDVDHLGQLEEDIADLIAHLAPKGPVILGGHSSGGGLAVRFAGGPFGHLANGFVLIAPFLKYNAPTQRPNSGGWAQPLTRRLIGAGHAERGPHPRAERPDRDPVCHPSSRTHQTAWGDVYRRLQLPAERFIRAAQRLQGRSGGDDPAVSFGRRGRRRSVLFRQVRIRNFRADGRRVLQNSARHWPSGHRRQCQRVSRNQYLYPGLVITRPAPAPADKDAMSHGPGSAAQQSAPERPGS